MLLAAEIATLPQGLHFDTHYLYLNVKGASRSWVMRYPRDAAGKKREEGLGSAAKVSLKLARDKRDERLKQLANGINPIEAKRAEREARANRKTFAEVARLKIAAKQSGWRTSFDGRTSTLDGWTRNLERDCAAIAAKAIDEISVDDIKRVVSPYWDRDHLRAGRDLLTRVEAVFNYAIAHGWRSAANPAAWSVFKELSPGKITKAPHAALPWREIPDFMRQLRASDAVAARVVEFAILTATRSGETRGARWSEIDLEACTWTIPGKRMKKGDEHIVPLSSQAVALLERVKGVAGDYVFPGYADDGRRTRDAHPVPNASVWKLTKRLGGDVTTHGFRSTFRDWCGEHAIDRELAERALAHKFGSAVESAYARSRLVARRAPVMQAWADFIDGVDNVVPLKRSA